MRTRKLLAALAATLLASGAALADNPLDEARRLLDAGDGAQAYALLVPAESARAGDPAFDLLLGIAALEAGETTRAIFALERAVTVDPGNARARAELARAYLAAGETDAARREFERVRKQDVPADVKRTIDRFLSTADLLDDRTRPTLRGHLEGGFGIDSNVNSAVGSASLAIPAFGGSATLDPRSVRTGDNFYTLGGGVRYRHPLGDGLYFNAGGTAGLRLHQNDDLWDQGNLDGQAGLAWERGQDVWSLGYQHNGLWLQSDRYRSANGLTGQWQRQLGGQDQVAAFLQYSNLYYPNQRLRDADRWVAGGAIGHGFGNGITGYAGLYAGTEREKAAAVPQLGHRLVGLRAGGEWALTGTSALFANLSYEHRRYGGSEPLFFVARRDDQWNLQIGANIGLARNWLLTPQISLIRNDSNVALYDYSRRIATVNLRRDF